MADDTRQPPSDLSREALNVSPDNKPFVGQQWQDGSAKTYNPKENANLMAEGASQHTAGGKIPEVTVWNALNVGTPITEVHKRPCVRDGLLYGMGTGFAVGGLRAIWGASVWRCCNASVFGMCLGSAISYQYCLYRRKAEKEGMMRAMEILNRKDVERKAREQWKQAARDERREAKDREQDVQLAALREAKDGTKKSWWNIW